jgi:exoribonuclease R
MHSALASTYTHVTAPLRRLVDRFGNEVVVSQCAGTEPPSWATEALPSLPELMADGRRREGAADRMGLDLVEAAVLSGCIGAELDGVVTSVSKGRASVQVREPAVVAAVEDDQLEPGDEVRLRVRSTDVAKRSVDFAVSRP